MKEKFKISCIDSTNDLYLYQRKQLKNIIMKIEARNLKEGMTITRGKWSLLVGSLTNSKQKNGTPTVVVKGLVKDTTKNIHGKTREDYNTEMVFKHLTKLNVK